MGYEKIQFNPGAAPGISAERLMHIQTQFDEALAELAKTDVTGGAGIVGVQPIDGIEGTQVQAVLAALKAYIDTASGNADAAATAVHAELDEHQADGVKHTSQAEKDAWNNKAAGNHNHAGVYEPVFSKNTAFNKNFGTTAETVCQGNDSRLSDSRKCNNTFDDAATSRTNLGLTGNSNTTHYHDGRYVQTRVSAGALQYYDGGWKDVGVMATKPRGVFSQISGVADRTWSTVLNVSGHGVLTRISALVLGKVNDVLQVRVTTDGVAYTYDTSPSLSAASLVETTTPARFDMIMSIEFKSSLTIETYAASSGAQIHECYIDYGLV